MKSMLRLLIIVTILSMGIGCRLENSVAGGSSSDGEAKIIGLAIDADGKPVIGASVRLRSEDYLQDPNNSSSMTPTGQYVNANTDGQGRFILTGIPAGTYAIEINNSGGLAILLRPTVSKAQLGTQVEMPDVILKPTGTIKGTIENFASPTNKGIVQVYGLDRVTILDSVTGAFFLTDIPVGLFRITSPSPDSLSLPVSVNNVSVISTVVFNVGSLERLEALETWKYSRKITFNPALLGNSGDVFKRFPVMVQLDGENFNFAEARFHGEDIRFTKPDGSRLKFGFRGWDSVSARAEIWVKLDSLITGPGATTFLMHWGKAQALPVSKGYDVFHTEAGFYGVWHLTKSPVGSDRNVLDSSSNRNIGRAVLAMPWADSGGLSYFGALRLDSTNPTVFTTKSYTPDSFTVSVWFKTTTKTGGRLGGMGDSRFLVSTVTDRQIWMNDEGRLFFGLNPGMDSASPGILKTISSPVAYNDGQWHQVVAVLSSVNGMHLYVDGASVASDANIRSAGKFIGYWRIGEDQMTGWLPLPSTPIWTGLMQEFWVIHRPMESEWIRLNYENTRPASTLVNLSGK
jgi:hypothetical protein